MVLFIDTARHRYKYTLYKLQSALHPSFKPTGTLQHNNATETTCPSYPAIGDQGKQWSMAECPLRQCDIFILGYSHFFSISMHPTIVLQKPLFYFLFSLTTFFTKEKNNFTKLNVEYFFPVFLSTFYSAGKEKEMGQCHITRLYC